MAKYQAADDGSMWGTHSARVTRDVDLRRLPAMRRRRDELAAGDVHVDLAQILGDLYALERLLISAGVIDGD